MCSTYIIQTDLWAPDNTHVNALCVQTINWVINVYSSGVANAAGNVKFPVICGCFNFTAIQVINPKNTYSTVNVQSGKSYSIQLPSTVPSSLNFYNQNLKYHQLVSNVLKVQMQFYKNLMMIGTEKQNAVSANTLLLSIFNILFLKYLGSTAHYLMNNWSKA